MKLKENFQKGRRILIKKTMAEEVWIISRQSNADGVYV